MVNNRQMLNFVRTENIYLQMVVDNDHWARNFEFETHPLQILCDVNIMAYVELKLTKLTK